MSLGTTIRDNTLNAWLRNSAFSTLPAPFVSLHSGDPTTTGASETAGGGYTRQAATFQAPSGGTCSLSPALTFSSMPAGSVSGVGVWTASTAGTFILGGTLTSASNPGSGNNFSLTTLTVSLA